MMVPIKCTLVLLLIVLTFISIFGDDRGEMYRWNKLSYSDAPRQESYQIHGKNYYIPEYNIPTGISPYRDRLFVSIARTNLGIPSTLNYIDFRDNRNNISPSIKAYPDYETNELHSDLSPDNKRIISVYRTRIDECYRLWFVDTGVLEFGNGETYVIQKPSIWVIDLRTHKTLNRVEIQESVHNNMPTGFVSINVDTDRRTCDEAYAYMPNSKANVLVVFSLKELSFWALSDSSMRPDQELSSITINGMPYDINEGIYSIVMGRKNRNNTRNIYYHPVACYQEYSISNVYLKKKELANAISMSTNITTLGNRGYRSNSRMHEYDLRHNVIFFTQMQTNSILCWNTDNSLAETNTAIVVENNATLINLIDIKNDYRGNIWYLSNKSPTYSTPSILKLNELNFFVYKRNTRELIKDTICENSILKNNIGLTKKSTEFIEQTDEEEYIDEW